LIDEFVALFRRPGVGAAWRQIQAREIVGGRFATDFSEQLAAIRQPTLVVHGAEDRTVPVAWARRAATGLPNGHLVLIARAGHITPLQQPDAFVTAIERFLARPLCRQRRHPIPALSTAPSRTTGVPQPYHGRCQMHTQRDGLKGRFEIKTGRKACNCSR
jgi:hypothetical protein